MTGFQSSPANISSCGNQMHVAFSSDYMVTRAGYYAKIHTSEGSCNGKSYYDGKVFKSKKSLTIHKGFQWKHNDNENRHGKAQDVTSKQFTCKFHEFVRC